MLHFLAYFGHCSLSPGPRAGLQLPSCTPAVLLSVTVSLTPHQQSHRGVPHPSLGLPGPFSCFPNSPACFSCFQAFPSFGCTSLQSETSEPGVEGRHELNPSYFFHNFRAFYTKSGSFLLAGQGCHFCVLLKMCPGKQYCRQNEKGFP